MESSPERRYLFASIVGKQNDRKRNETLASVFVEVNHPSTGDSIETALVVKSSIHWAPSCLTVTYLLPAVPETSTTEKDENQIADEATGEEEDRDDERPEHADEVREGAELEHSG